MTIKPMSVISDPVPAVLDATQPRTNRLALLDTARLAAAMGIVWVHVATSATGKALYPIGTFGVPFYTFIAVLFMARALTRQPVRPVGHYVQSRFYRIYVPFLFWSLTYLVLGNLKLIMEHQPTEWLDPTALYCGDEEHLWFLPFLMIVTVGGAFLFRAVQNRLAWRNAVAAIFIVLGFAACLLHEPAWISTRTDDYFFFHYAFRALPTVFWSIAVALIGVFDGKLPQSSLLVAIGGLCLMVMALALQPQMTPLPILRSLAGLGCVLLALRPLSTPLIAQIGSLGRYSYGIYLSHMAFIRILTMGTSRLHLQPSLMLDLASFAIAFACACLVSVALGQSKWTRWTIGD